MNNYSFIDESKLHYWLKYDSYNSDVDFFSIFRILIIDFQSSNNLKNVKSIEALRSFFFNNRFLNFLLATIVFELIVKKLKIFSTIYIHRFSSPNYLNQIPRIGANRVVPKLEYQLVRVKWLVKSYAEIILVEPRYLELGLLKLFDNSN